MCMTSQIVWYTTPNEQERKIYEKSVCVCGPRLSETVCAYTFSMRLHCFDMLSCPDLQIV